MNESENFESEKKSSEFSNKRGRPKKAEAKEKEVEFINLFSASEITPTISFLLNTIFSRKGWEKLNSDEEKNLGSCLTKVLNKHFPKVITRYVEEMQLIVVVGGIFTARILTSEKQNNFDTGKKGEWKNNDSEKTIDTILQDNNIGQSL